MEHSHDNKEKAKKQSLDFSNPFTWWGLAVLVIGVSIGGALGAGLGAATGFSIISVSKKKISSTKKIIYSVLITLAGTVLLLVLASIVSVLISK